MNKIITFENELDNEKENITPFSKYKKPRSSLNYRIPTHTEIKSVDKFYTFATNDTGEMIIINEVDQGNTSSQRKGRQIVMTSIEMIAYFQTIGFSPNPVRLMVIYDKKGTILPPVADVIQGGVWNAHTENAERDRFIILYDQIIALSGNPPCVIKTWKQKIWLPATYNQQGGATDVATFGVIRALVIDKGNDGDEITCSFRVRFIDS